MEPVGSTRRTRARFGPDRRAALVLTAPAAALLGLLLLYPTALLLRMSTSDVKLENILREWPFVGFDNYTSLLGDATFRAVALQTTVFLLITVTATVGLALLVSLVLLPDTRLSRTAGLLLMMVWTLPLVVVGSMWKFLLATDGAINAMLPTGQPISFLASATWALPSVAAVTAWVSIPFSAVVVRAAILDVPREIFEAATVDGARRTAMVRHIVLPSIRPTLAIIVVLNVINAFKSFDLIYVMTKGGPGTSSSTIPFLGYLTAFRGFDFGSAAAIAVVAMLIVLILSIAYVRGTAVEQR